MVADDDPKTQDESFLSQPIFTALNFFPLLSTSTPSFLFILHTHSDRSVQEDEEKWKTGNAIHNFRVY